MEPQERLRQLEDQYAAEIKACGEQVKGMKEVSQLWRDLCEQKKAILAEEKEQHGEVMAKLQSIATMQEQVSNLEKEIARRRIISTDDVPLLRPKRSILYDMADLALGHIRRHEKGGNDGGEWLTRAWDRIVKQADPLTTDDATAGKEFVPTPLSSEIYMLLEDEGTAMGQCTKIPMDAMTMTVADPGSVTVAWQSVLGGEGTTATDQQPTTGSSTLTADTLIATMGLTQQLLRTSNVNLIQVYTTRFMRRMSREFESQILAGSGTPFTGISDVSGATQVQLDTGETKPEDVTFADIANLVGNMSKEALRGATWWFHPLTLALLRNVRGDDGQPIFSPPGANVASTIYGIPYQTSYDMIYPTGAAQTSKVFIELGNLEHVLLGTVEDMRFDVSYDAAFRQYMAVLRAVMVAGVLIPDATAFGRIKTAAS